MVSTYKMKVDTSMQERIAEKIDGFIVGRTRDGRNIYSSAGKRALIHACLQPGVSVAGSALANGVNANLLRKWIQRYQGQQSSKKPTAKSNHRLLPLLPIQLTEPSPASKTAHDPASTIDGTQTVAAQNHQIVGVAFHAGLRNGSGRLQCALLNAGSEQIIGRQGHRHVVERIGGRFRVISPHERHIGIGVGLFFEEKTRNGNLRTLSGSG